MADMTISVKITGDASSLSGAIDSAKAKLSGLHDSINNSTSTDGLSKIGPQIEQIGNKCQKFGKLYTAGVTVPIVAGSKTAVEKFASVDKTMTLTNATMKNTTEEADLLEKAMKDAAANSVFGMEEAANASLNFARAGLDAKQAADTLAPAMNLAAGEGGDLDTVSAGLVATINGFHGSFDQAAQYADVFANACNNSALDIDSLSQSMSIAAPTFSAAGYEINDAATYMGIMANRGIEANKAANSLKTGFARLVDPPKAAKKAMEALGLSVTNADGSMKDSVQIQKELHDAFAGLSDSEKLAAASAIFGKNQMAPWLALIESSPDEVAELSKALEEEGTTSQMADAMMSGFGGSLEKLKSSIDVAATSFGEALSPAISKVADKIQSLVDWFNQLSPEQQQQIAKWTAIAAAIGPVLIVLGKIVATGGSLITTFGGLNGSILPMLGSLGKFAGIAGLVIGAFIGMYQNSEQFREAVGNLVGSALTSLKDIFEALKPAFEAVMEALQPLLSALGDALAPVIDILAGSLQLLTPLLVGLIEAFAWLVEAISPVIDWVSQLISLFGDSLAAVVEVVGDAIGGIIEWFQGMGDTISSVKDTVSNAWDTIKNAVEVALMFIAEIIETYFELITLPWRLIWENCKEYVFAAWEKIKTTVSEALAPIVEWIGNAWDTIKTKTSEVWDAITEKAQVVFNAIHDHVVEPTEKATGKLEQVWSGIKEKLSGWWSDIKTSASETWEGIKDAVTKPIEEARDVIVGAWRKVKRTLESAIDWPDIKVPHFTTTGSFSLDPPSVPHFNFEWMAKGGIATRASIVGVGEAGPEAIAPIDKLKAYVAEAVTNARNATMDYAPIDSLADAIATGFAMQNAGQNTGGEYHFTVELGGARVAEKIFTLNKEGQMIMQGA